MTQVFLRGSVKSLRWSNLSPADCIQYELVIKTAVVNDLISSSLIDSSYQNDPYQSMLVLTLLRDKDILFPPIPHVSNLPKKIYDKTNKKHNEIQP